MPQRRIQDISVHLDIQGKGTPLILLHGLQGDSSNFESLIPSLTSSYQVITFDQRGSGWSDKPNEVYNMALLADDTAHLLDVLDIDQAHVFGVSMGGMIAQEFALRHPQRVRALVLGCTGSGGSGQVSLDSDPRASAYELSSISDEERARRLALAGFSQQFLRANPDMIDRLIAARRKRPLNLAALARRRQALETHDTTDRLGAIRAPTLVITGLQDAIVQAENSRLLAERIPHAQLVELSSAGHLFWMEQPKQTLDAVLSFLRRH